MTCFSTREKAAKFHLTVISEMGVALMWPACDGSVQQSGLRTAVPTFTGGVLALNIPAAISASPGLWQVTVNFVSGLFFWCKTTQTVACLTDTSHLRRFFDLFLRK